MKKLVAMILALTLVLSFAACGAKKEEAPAAPEAETPAVEENVVIELPVEDDPSINEPAAMPEEGEQLPEVMPEVTPEEAPEEIPEEELPEVEYMPEEKLNEMMSLMDGLVGGINDELMVGTMEITADMYEYYAIPATEGIFAVVSMPMIGSIAHEVVLVELPEGTDAAAFAAEMEGMMNPRKWVCVEAETSWVKTSGQYVLMVMSTADMAAAIEANFNNTLGQ